MGTHTGLSRVWLVYAMVLVVAACGGGALTGVGPGPGSDPEVEPESGSPGWIVQCPFSHALADDPIVHFGHAGASHLHDFFANRSTNASSTYSSMATSETTCSPTSGDTAGYWTPALYRDGVKIDPAGSYGGRNARQRFYYRKNNLASTTRIHAPPPDLRVVVGNAGAMTAADNPLLGREIYWGCADNSTGKLKEPPTSCSVGIISLHVGFPNCWDGRNPDSADHRSHLAYPKSGACPATHPVAIPRIIMRLEFPVGTTTGNITLASGSVYSIHGDFWNTWDQSRLQKLTDDCLNRNVDCGRL
ncbi:MAG: DUF1996 domain-containing protein [Armatimonadota bacterium]|nr:DUF1996 domain-containing protein [Armatimonadota bacterium]MDR5697875.1 DUF1996 domain-containing protein [Armatimonadota bacterium]